ncbi:MAG: hypothetical protein ACAH27_05765 [Xanthobacteraceae bacterium]
MIAPFAFAADGFTVEDLVPGDERDFGDVRQGLIDASLVAPQPAAVAAPAIPAAVVAAETETAPDEAAAPLDEAELAEDAPAAVDEAGEPVPKKRRARK